MLPKDKFFKLAKRVAERSTSTPRLGCVIVSKNKVISFGYNNMSKTHPKSNHPYKTLHAEIHALIGVPSEELVGCDVYVYREIKSGRVAIAKPCDTCMQALQVAKIKKVFFTTNTGWEVCKLGD
jgi:deoxycytidylate deaminase